MISKTLKEVSLFIKHPPHSVLAIIVCTGGNMLTLTPSAFLPTKAVTGREHRTEAH